MSVTLTAFGRFTRKLRVDRGELLKDMSRRLGVTPSYLSAVETGRRNIPAEWVDKLCTLYDLSSTDVNVLQNAVLNSCTHDKVDVSHLSSDDRRLVARVVKYLPILTTHQRGFLDELVRTHTQDG